MWGQKASTLTSAFAGYTMGQAPMDRKPSLIAATPLLLALMASGPVGLSGTAAGGSTSSALAQEPQEIVLSPAESQEILQGQIVVRRIPNPGRKGRTYEAVGVIQGTLEEVYAILTDYRAYRELHDTLTIISVRDESDTAAVVEYSLDLPLGMKKIFRMRYAAQKGAHDFFVSWQKLPWPELKPRHAVTDTSGFWRVRELESGGLLAAARIYADPGPVPLGLKGLALSLTKKRLPAMIRSVRRRLVRLRTLSSRANHGTSHP